MNVAPTLKVPNDEAFWARLYFVNFTQRFLADPDPEAPHEHPVDTRLFDKIKKEASGILAWMVRGFRDWRQNNNTFIESPSMKAEKEKYKEVSDPVRQRVCRPLEQQKQAVHVDAFAHVLSFLGKEERHLEPEGKYVWPQNVRVASQKHRRSQKPESVGRQLALPRPLPRR